VPRGGFIGGEQVKKVVGLLMAVLVLSPLPRSFGFSGKGQDCSKCHTLSKVEAEALLKAAIPNVRILEIRTAPVKSMWEIDVESNGKRGLVYLDFSKQYLFSGAIIDIRDMKNVTRERFTEINRVNVSDIPLKDALVLGRRNARKKVIVFTDPDCLFCARLHGQMKEVVAERKDIVFFIKMFPLPMHKEAYEKAEAIVCEKSLRLLEDSYEHKPLPKARCKTSAVDDSIAVGKKMGVTATPTLIMPNGRMTTGTSDTKTLIADIDRK
jgi:thiol:disulfide interchange protein DsbC